MERKVGENLGDLEQNMMAAGPRGIFDGTSFHILVDKEAKLNRGQAGLQVSKPGDFARFVFVD
jgi:hypothetical protein